MSGPNREGNQGANHERTVRCPICGEEKLARGLYLHVNRSVGDGHGPQGEIPDDVDLDNVETVGEKQVKMDYPETRQTEQVGRRCPYCEEEFRGTHGVMIHLGSKAGTGPHPEDAKERLEPEDLAIVHVNEAGEVVEVVEDGAMLPSTQRRREREEKQSLEDRVQAVVAEFRQEGKEEAADRLEEALRDA